MKKGWFGATMLWLAGTRVGRWLAIRFYTPFDKAVYRLTGGKRGAGLGKISLLLTTTGRRSGQPRSAPVIYVPDGNSYWIMASNYGQQNHPAWSYNLMADPEATVTIAGKERPVRAHLVSREEKEAMWPRLTAHYPGWNMYRTLTDRDFRLFRLDPVDQVRD